VRRAGRLSCDACPATPGRARAGRRGVVVQTANSSGQWWTIRARARAAGRGGAGGRAPGHAYNLLLGPRAKGALSGAHGRAGAPAPRTPRPQARPRAKQRQVYTLLIFGRASHAHVRRPWAGFQGGGFVHEDCTVSLPDNKPYSQQQPRPLAARPTQAGPSAGDGGRAGQPSWQQRRRAKQRPYQVQNGSAARPMAGRARRGTHNNNSAPPEPPALTRHLGFA
jgi:hypothetical protein